MQPTTLITQTDLRRAEIAALAKACADALKHPGNPCADERYLDILDAAYKLTQCDDLHDARIDHLSDLGLDEDGSPLTDTYGDVQWPHMRREMSMDEQAREDYLVLQGAL